jgi:hypothetical protein
METSRVRLRVALYLDRAVATRSVWAGPPGLVSPRTVGSESLQHRSLPPRLCDCDTEVSDRQTQLLLPTRSQRPDRP